MRGEAAAAMVGYTAVRFVAEPETYPVWAEYNRKMLREVYGDGDTTEIPSRELLLRYASILANMIFNGLDAEDLPGILRAYDQIPKR